jgi:hypothetical protein
MVGNVMGTFILGVGTGRCGTSSLSNLLTQQPRSKVTHERYGHRVRWNCPPSLWPYRLFRDTIRSQELYFGDVAFYWTPHIETFIEFGDRHNVKVRVVGLVRPKDEVISSYVNWVRMKNHWIHHQGKDYNYSEWDHCYPAYNPSLTRKEAIGEFWEHVNDDLKLLANKYNQVEIFETRELNNEVGVRAILNHVEIPKVDQYIEVGIRENSSRYNA